MFKERPTYEETQEEQTGGKRESKKTKVKSKRRTEFDEALERAKKIPLKEALKQYEKPHWNLKEMFKWPVPEVSFEELPETLQQNISAFRNVTIGAVAVGILTLIFIHSIGVMLTCLLFGFIFWIMSRYRERLYCSNRLIYLDGTVEREENNFLTKGKNVYIVDEEDGKHYRFVVQNKSRIRDSKNDHYLEGDVVRLYLDKKILPQIRDGFIPDYFTVTIIKNSPLIIDREEDDEELEEERERRA